MKNNLITFSVLSALFFFMPFQANAAITYATWNASDKAPWINLVGSNLTAQMNTTTWAAVRATIAPTTGKWYWEITAGQNTNGDLLVGLLTSGTSLNYENYANSSTAWTDYAQFGDFYNAGNLVFDGTAWTTGDVISFAYDADTGSYWAAVNGVWQNNGNPSAGTRYIWTGLAAALYPFFAGSQNGDSVTVNFGASPFAYAVPSGFNAGLYIDDGLPPPPPPPPPTTGTLNKLAKFITTTTLGDSLLSDDGSNTTLTSGNLFMQIGSMIDTIVAGTLNFGTTNATSITIGRSGVTTTFPGPLAVNGLATFGNNVTVPGTVSLGKVTTADNCSSSATPAVCGAASAGSVAMPTTGTLVVNTSAVTVNSQILITENSALGTRLGITCNTTTGRVYSISAMTAGVSFVIKSSVNPKKDKACLSYWIIN